METINRCLVTFLLNALWEIPLLAAVAWLAERLLRKGPAGHRHAVWTAALVAALCLPLASVRFDRAAAGQSYALPSVMAPAGRAPAATTAAPAAAGRPASAPRERSVRFTSSTGALLAGGYLLFLLFRLALLVRAGLRTAQIRRDSAPVEASPLLEAVWRRSKQAFGVKDVQLRASAGTCGPIMVGAWRKIVILPRTLVAGQPEEVLATAIGHEMAHIARHDFALNLLCEFLYAPVAFHPAAWIVRRAVERTRELACDELVTRRLMDPRVYARSIVSIAADLAGVARPGYTLGVFDGDILEERIKRLVDQPSAGLKRARLWLAAGLAGIAACVVAASGLAISARAQSAARPEVKLGVGAYNNGDFAGAVSHFENAVNLDPANLNAKLFLANAYLREFATQPPKLDTSQSPVPVRNAVAWSAESPLVTGALRQYRDVLARDPSNLAAMFGVASLEGAGQWQEGHDLMLKSIAADPTNKNAYYMAGVLDWQLAFRQVQEAFHAAGMRPDNVQIPDAAVRKSLRDKIQPQIEEAFRLLQIALQLDPNWPEALAYLNLVYRSDAAIVDSATESRDLIRKADACVDQALALRRAKARQSTAPAILDADGAPPVTLPGPPPPPPLPPGRVRGEPAR